MNRLHSQFRTPNSQQLGIGDWELGVDENLLSSASTGAALMNVMTRRLTVAIAGVLFLSAHVHVQSGDDARRLANKQWPAVSGDWGNTRHSTLNQITNQNITKLGAAWTSEKF